MSKLGVEQELPTLLGPGARLRMAREQAGLTQRDAALDLRLNEALIAEIESDNYHNMPGFVFLRGYLRAYAKLLHVNGDEIIYAFNDLKLPEQNNAKPLVTKKYFRTSEGIVRWIVYLGILSMVAWGGYYWYTQKTTLHFVKPAVLSNMMETLRPIMKPNAHKEE